MPIAATIRIIVLLTGQVDRPAAPPPEVMAHQTIQIWPLPASGPGAFALRASTGGPTREARLSTVEAERLTTLLAQLPAHGMAAPASSFDGFTYELMIVRADESLSFHWQNDDWRFTPQDSRAGWERVAAVVDFVLSLVKKRGET